MKRIVLLIAVAAATVASCAPGHRMTNLTVADDAKVRAANAEYDRALIAANAGALDGIYTEDFLFIGGKAELRNKREQISSMTDGAVRLLSGVSDEIAVSPLGPNHVLLTGRFSGRYRAGANERDFVERYSSVWVNDGSRWRLRHEHSSLAPAKS
jgi:ketosteroid isomerase-like protein